MPENETAAQTDELKETAADEAKETDAETGESAAPEDITYQAVQKDGTVTAIWEMQGRRHLRTIDPRSRDGQEILRLFTAEDHEHAEETAA